MSKSNNQSTTPAASVELAYLIESGARGEAAGDIADLELLALGREHERMAQQFKAAHQRLAPLNTELNRRLGEWRATAAVRTDDEIIKARQRISDELGISRIAERGEHTDDIANVMDPIARAIMEMPATTLGGLAVKAKVAAFNASGLWDDPAEDCDWDTYCLRKLIEDVLQAAKASS